MEIRDVAKANASCWNPSRHIGHATFDRNLCETLVAVFRVTSHRSQTKTPDPFSFFSFLFIPLGADNRLSKSMAMPGAIHAFSNYDCPCTSRKEIVRFS